MRQRAFLLLFLLSIFTIMGCFLDKYKSEDGEKTKVEPTVTLQIETTSGFNVSKEIVFTARGKANGSDLYYIWRVDGKEKSESSDKLTISFSEDGEHTIEVKAAASATEESDWERKTVEIAPDKAPLIQNQIPTNIVAGQEVVLSVQNIGDGEIEKCQWSIGNTDTTTESSSINWIFDNKLIDSTIVIEVILVNDHEKSAKKTLKCTLIPASYPTHKNIIASTFWCGEGASGANDNISNHGSAWHSLWAVSFGLEDHPTKIQRNDRFIPTSEKFTGEQNPYYFALPYNDFGNIVYDGKEPDKKTDKMINGDKWGKKESSLTAPFWKNSNLRESACKNRWIEIRYKGKACYAQWEDAGPYYYEDTAYVFGDGSVKPLCTQEMIDAPYAGIDLSPSVWLYLGQRLDSWGVTDVIDSWRFVDFEEVPDGPWKEHITTNQCDWSK